VHGHSTLSLDSCPVWEDVAPHWLRFAQGAQLIVWNAAFHLDCLDRALLQADHPPMAAIASGITDLKALSGQTRRTELLARHGLDGPDEPASALSEAGQLARLWLALGRP
jgi:DNA polymerase III epsilon subunit-like protein